MGKKPEKAEGRGTVIDRVRWRKPRHLNYDRYGEPYLQKPGSTVALLMEPGDEYDHFHENVYTMLLRHADRMVSDLVGGGHFALDYVHEEGCFRPRDDAEPCRCRIVAELVELADVEADHPPLVCRYWTAGRGGWTYLRGVSSSSMGYFLTFFLDYCGRLFQWDK
jgi:hypothetical protein